MLCVLVYVFSHLCHSFSSQFLLEKGWHVQVGNPKTETQIRMIQFRLPYFASDWHPGEIAFTKVISRKVPVVPRPQKGPRPIVEPAYNDRLEDTDSPENGLSLLISHDGSMRMLYLPTFYHKKSTKCILYRFMFYEALELTDSQGSSTFLLWHKNGIEHISMYVYLYISISIFIPTWRAFVTFLGWLCDIFKG